MIQEVDQFLEREQKWQAEMEHLRSIVLDCQLTEELKWGKPCYSYQNSNIVIIQGFKEYCALLFFKGALLHDYKDILIRTGENTQAGRQIRFTRVEEIREREHLIRSYIFEAIEVEKAGLKISYKKPEEFPVPEELNRKMNEMAILKAAFESLTPGRQRAYLLYFSEPKQSKTRESRIEKWIPQILNGKGLNDR